MRLTNFHRSAIVAAALQDVPTVNYIEQLRTLINKKVLAFQKANKLDLVEPTRLISSYIHLAGQSFSTTGMFSTEKNTILDSPDVVALVTAHRDQQTRISALSSSLRSVLEGCTTVAQAKQMLPEFEKYFPSSTTALSRSVPVLANVLSDFVKAGWPKQNTRIVQQATPNNKPAKKKAAATA